MPPKKKQPLEELKASEEEAQDAPKTKPKSTK